jgi:RNA polymerase sigma factor (sigma-70 family)
MRHAASLSEIDQYALVNIRAGARRLIGRFGFAFQDRDDLVQELFLDYLGRVRKYDPTQSRIRSFVSRIIRHHVHEMIRARLADRVWMNSVPLDQPGEPEQVFGLSEEDHPRRDLRIEVEATLGDLPPQLARVARLLQHHSISETSRILGVSRARVYQWIAQLREAFRSRGIDGERLQ